MKKMYGSNVACNEVFYTKNVSLKNVKLGKAIAGFAQSYNNNI